MQKKALEGFKNRLLDTRRRLVDEVGSIEQTITDDSGNARELSHMPTHNADHDSEGVDVQITLAQNEEGLLEQVEAALERIEQGTYGKCENCGSQVSVARLEAIPYTPYCIKCAESLERAERAGTHRNGELTMVNQSARGGMKEPGDGAPKKLSVRPGSSAAKKQRANQAPRQKVVPSPRSKKK